MTSAVSIIAPTGITDDFSLAPGMGASTQVIALANDGSGVLYSGGYGLDAGAVRHWIVRKSSDNGATWKTVDDFQYTAGLNSEPAAIASTSTGDVYVAGYGLGSNGFKHWIVRKSADAGKSWSTIDDFVNSAGYNSAALCLAVSTGGAISVGGYGALQSPVTPTTAYEQGIIRRSTDSGGTWSQVHLEDITYNYVDAPVTAMAIDAGGTLMAAVSFSWFTWCGTWCNGWSIKSTDGGATWAETNNISMNVMASGSDFYYAAQYTSLAAGVAAGTFYATATQFDQTATSPTNHSFIWKTTNSGTTWTQVDEATYSGHSLTPTVVKVDSAGKVYVLANADAGLAALSVIRVSTDGGTSWSNQETYQYATGKISGGLSFGISATGQTLWGGYGTDSKNISHWLFRRL
ncbi:MAG: WD40/YVTN/BNR-like repeat-containing protein [Bdellovibrionota bacterium]